MQGAERHPRSGWYYIPLWEAARRPSALPASYSLRQEAMGCPRAQAQGSADAGVDCELGELITNPRHGGPWLRAVYSLRENATCTPRALPSRLEPKPTLYGPPPRNQGSPPPQHPYSTPKENVSTAGRKWRWPEPQAFQESSSSGAAGTTDRAAPRCPDAAGISGPSPHCRSFPAGSPARAQKRDPGAPAELEPRH